MTFHPLPFILALLVALQLAGCTSRPDNDDLLPLEFTYIRIGQDQFDVGVNPTYAGSVSFPACRHNPNKFDLKAQTAFEVYLVVGPPNSGLRLVKESDSTPRTFPAGFSTIPVGMDHAVLLNETAAGNSTDYVIHLWHQILNPEPIHRVDRWFNMTFTPYGPSSTTYEEGTPCRTFSK